MYAAGTVEVAPDTMNNCLRMGNSDHAKAVNAIQNARPKIHKIYHESKMAPVRSKLERMDDLLAMIHDQLHISATTMRTAVNSVGLNLRNGHFYGSPSKLARSLRSKGGRVDLSIVKQKPSLKYVKYCLIRLM